MPTSSNNNLITILHLVNPGFFLTNMETVGPCFTLLLSLLEEEEIKEKLVMETKLEKLLETHLYLSDSGLASASELVEHDKRGNRT